MGSGYSDPRPLLRIFHLEDKELDVLGRLKLLPLHLLALLEDCVNLSKVNVHVVAYIALNDSCHHIFFAAVPMIE